MATTKASATKKSTGKSTGKTAAKKTSAKKTPSKATAAKSATRKSAAKGAARKAPAKVPGQRSAPKKTSAPDKYSDPALRERIKAKVMREDKGGRPGQWSARKAQMVAHEYEAEGGKYKGGRDATQQNLTAWGDEHWTTSDGKPAERKDGMHRYLPEKAWKELTPAEKRSTERKKLAGDKQGKQFVANTSTAVKARRAAEKKAPR